MSEDGTLDEFVDAEGDDAPESVTDADTIDQEQFGPFTLSTPGGWSAKRLGDIKRLITRGKQPTYDDDGIPVINQECIYWDGWHFENLRYLDEDVGEDWKDKYFPQSGDVILNSTGQGTLGRAQVYPDNKRHAIDSHVTLLRTDDELNPYFHRYFLESHLGQALLYSMCVNGSTGQIELSKTRLDLQPVPLPPLPEQRKIATVLYTVDRAIEKTEEVITRFDRLFTGTRRTLLRQGTNSDTSVQSTPTGRYPSNWKLVRAGNFVELRNGEYLAKKERTEDGDYPVYGGNGIMGHTEESIVGPETVVIGRVGAYCGNVHLTEEDAWVTDNAIILSELSDEYLPQFIIHLIDEIGLGQYSEQSAQPRISQSTVENLRIPKPPVDEQQEIVDSLSSITNAKDTEKTYKNQLKRLKHGLMQDLLSGTVRTTDTNIEVPEEIAKYG